jgi:NYN domain-containing protein
LDVTRRGQKGVDSRIVRDMIVLAHNRACTNAYLVSGDDDLREGVSEAQEGGVSVKLIGVEPLTGIQNQAPTLVRAADETMTLSTDQILQFLSKRPSRIAPAIAVPTPVTVASLVATGAADVRSRGAEFALDWIGRTTGEQQKRLVLALPNIPGDLDHLLLEFGRSCRIDLSPGSPLRIELREGFRVQIRASVKVS